ncbi:hypothetical protein RF11_03017 [Thelohanellus kitauei]|uniref:Uncharacterized protein n=1 Tax=Thelohanellus kitauei TaxID=669202 RepID=A0A0C2MVG3_THEKT|nr:hypothetical protein RF11_03017 [Thelohanellus kitauei]
MISPGSREVSGSRGSFPGLASLDKLSLIDVEVGLAVVPEESRIVLNRLKLGGSMVWMEDLPATTSSFLRIFRDKPNREVCEVFEAIVGPVIVCLASCFVELSLSI